MSAHTLKKISLQVYQKNIQAILKKFSSEHGIQTPPESLHDLAGEQQQQLANWLVRLSTEIQYSPRYLNAVKFSILHAVKSAPPGSIDNGFIRSIQSWKPLSRQASILAENADAGGSNTIIEENYDEMNILLRRRRRTTGRMIPKEDWESLANYFEANQNIGNTRAYFFLLSTIGCGARPVEWIHAQLIDDKTVRIYTAKRRDAEKWEKIASGLDYDKMADLEIDEETDTELITPGEINANHDTINPAYAENKKG